ncbi:hypothetical protein E4K10_20355 [Streptomyces sp. T1317-0309]|nr:hypothetical protein E4K10_20355 [Streptomyces sp. T1317-0309]
MPVVKPAGAVSALATGGDVIAYQYGGGRVELWNAVDGSTRSVQTPAGLQLLTEYSDLAVGWRSVQAPDGTTVREMHLLIPDADGTTRDVPVGGLPEGVNLGAPVGGDATGLLFNASEDGRYLSIMVDRRTGQVQSLTPLRSKVYLKAQITADHVVLFNPNEAAVQVLSRSDLSAAPVGVTLDGTGSVNPADGLAVVGDWLVHRPSAGTAVTAVPIAGGAAVTVLTSSDSPVSAVSDGTAVVVGRTTADDWGIQRIRAGADGRPAVTQVKALPKPPYRIEGLALEQGRLIVAEERDQGYRRAYGRTVAATGTPEFGERSLYSDDLFGCPSAEGACRLFATPDNRAVWLTRDTASIDRLRADGPDEGRPAGVEPSCGRADHRRLGPVRDPHDRDPAAGRPTRQRGRERRPRTRRRRSLGRRAVDGGDHSRHGHGLRPDDEEDHRDPHHRRRVHAHRTPGVRPLDLLDLRREGRGLRPRHAQVRARSGGRGEARRRFCRHARPAGREADAHDGHGRNAREPGHRRSAGHRGLAAGCALDGRRVRPERRLRRRAGACASRTVRGAAAGAESVGPGGVQRQCLRGPGRLRSRPDQDRAVEARGELASDGAQQGDRQGRRHPRRRGGAR